VQLFATFAPTKRRNGLRVLGRSWSQPLATFRTPADKCLPLPYHRPSPRFRPEPSSELWFRTPGASRSGTKRLKFLEGGPDSPLGPRHHARDGLDSQKGRAGMTIEVAATDTHDTESRVGKALIERHYVHPLGAELLAAQGTKKSARRSEEVGRCQLAAASLRMSAKPRTPPPNYMESAQLKRRLANSPAGAVRGHGCLWLCHLPKFAVRDNDSRGSKLRAIGTEALSIFLICNSFQVTHRYCHFFPIR
jgi:hypothetical protein